MGCRTCQMCIDPGDTIEYGPCRQSSRPVRRAAPLLLVILETNELQSRTHTRSLHRRNHNVSHSIGVSRGGKLHRPPGAMTAAEYPPMQAPARFNLAAVKAHEEQWANVPAARVPSKPHSLTSLSIRRRSRSKRK